MRGSGDGKDRGWEGRAGKGSGGDGRGEDRRRSEGRRRNEDRSRSAGRRRNEGMRRNEGRSLEFEDESSAALCAHIRELNATADPRSPRSRNTGNRPWTR